MHPISTARCDTWRGGTGFFLLGVFSLLIQTLLVREALFVFHGGEIGLGLFFAVWLSGIAAGAALGSRMVARHGDAAALRCTRLFTLGLGFLPCAGLAQLALFRYHRAVIPVAAGGYLPVILYLGLLLVAAAPAGVLTGFLFPVGLRAWRTPPGAAYGIEALGSIVGGAMASLYALPRFPAAVILAAAGPVALIWIVLTVGLRRPPGSWRSVLFPALVGLGLGLSLVTGSAARKDAQWLRDRWELLGTGTYPRASLDTPYHQVTLGERQGEISLYLDGLYHGALHDPYVDSLTAAVIATQHPVPERIAVLAPGFFGAVPVLAGSRGHSLLHIREDEDIDRALEEVDDRFGGGRLRRARTAATTWVVRAADGAEGSPQRRGPRRFRALSADSRQAVARMRGTVDMIVILYGGGATGSTNRLYTRECFAACARRLKPGGVLALDIPGAANVATPEDEILRASIVAALRAEFADVRIAPGPTHYVFAALPRAGDDPADLPTPLTWDPDSLARRRHRLWPSGRPWPVQLFANLFPPDRVQGLAAAVMADADRQEPNSDGKPLVYYQQLRRWDRLSGSGLSAVLRAAYRAPWVWGLALLAFLVVAGFPVRRRLGHAAVSLATTGCAGMGASLLVLLLYPTYLGTLYLQVGLVSAVFMTGLAGGALLGAKLGGRGGADPQVGRRTVAWLDVAWVVLLAAMIPLPPVLSSIGGTILPYLLLAVTALAGLMTALPFAAVAALLRTHRREAPAAGGIADAADHVGAVFGALVTGTFLVPLMGFAGTLLLLAGLKALSALGSFLPDRSARGC